MNVAFTMKRLKLGNQNLLTNPGLVKLHTEGLDQVFQERPDQPEVDPADTPGTIHQNNNVGYGRSLTHKALFTWRRTDRDKHCKFCQIKLAKQSFLLWW